MPRTYAPPCARCWVAGPQVMVRAAGDPSSSRPQDVAAGGSGRVTRVCHTGSGLRTTVFAHGLTGSIETTRLFGSGVRGSRTFMPTLGLCRPFRVVPGQVG